MPRGILIVTMEPPSDMEDEFNDWYDTEHFPERKALPGFGAAGRWACIEGWPRYLALYELRSVASLETPEYRAVSGEHASPWTRRVVPRCVGRRRVVGIEVGTRAAPLPPPHALSRLLLARFPRADEAAIEATLGVRSGAVAGAAAFRAGEDLWLIAAFARPVGLAELTGAYGEVAGKGASLFNLYVPYLRGE